MTRSAKQKENDKRLGQMAKARAAGGSGAQGRGWSLGKKAGKGKKAKKGHHRPSAAVIAKMRAGGKRYWAAKRGKPKRPMPLKVLKQHRDRLNQLIAKGGK